MVIPFGLCDARKDQRLSNHLSSVALRMAPNPQSPVDWLARLAGLLHDIGKARAEWQDYLKTSLAGKKCRPVPHAHLGASLLAPLGQWLLEEMNAWNREHQDALIRWVIDIADHHGKLSDLELNTKPPWVGVWNRKDLDDVDWSGIYEWLNEKLPLEPPEWLRHPDSIAEKVKEFSKSKSWPCLTSKVIQYRGRLLDRATQREREACRSCLRLRTASLVAADRLDAGAIQIDRLDKERAARAIDELENHLRRMREQNNGRTIDELREIVRREALNCWSGHPDAPIYTLALPTGYGKTFTSLRVALEACRQGKARRIIYVAPHISILSQAAEQIRRATSLDVMEHHYLSVAVREDMDEEMYLVMESWQAPVVATTFHQLFRALFPRRAQHTLRLPALERAVVILDEPQMIDPAKWNVLLSMLEAAHEEMGTQALLVTATLPDTSRAEIQSPVPLVGNSELVKPVVRYVVRASKENLEEPWDEEHTAQVFVERAGTYRQGAVILNTIVDACRVYRAVRDQTDLPVLFLHGLMLPVHKAYRLEELRCRLQKDEPFLVVGTPILECGLDISFPLILRALPVLPSVVQTAGRINRHGNKRRGVLEVFNFRRGGEKDTRPWIYRRLEEREVTDDLLCGKELIEEPDLIRMAESYYSEVFRRNEHRARYEDVVQAAKGEWSRVAGWEPFDEQQLVPNRTVFFPIGEKWMDGERLEQLLRAWECEEIEDLYERYMDQKYMADLSFLDRKRFLSALQAFSVAVTVNMLGRLAVVGDRAIARCSDPSLYDEDTGLAHLRDADSADAWIW